MGLIKAVVGSLTQTLAETWKDYFVCDALDNDTLMVKGVKKGNGGSGEIISNGSGIVVNEGQCALVVDEGQILEVACEPGNYTFDTSLSPSIFDGGFKGIKDTFKDMIGRFTYGGELNKNQRVYYINTKEIIGNMYGTATPIPFRVIDKNINLDVDIAIRCNGEYSFKIVNPLVFYKNVAGNTKATFTKEELVAQMKSEVLTALQPAFAKISSEGVRYSEVPAHTDSLATALNESLNTKWTEGRGIAFVNIGINSISANPEDEKKIRDLQMAAVNKDQTMAAATLVSAQADAMRDAANNANGAMNGFVGMNMASNIGGANANELFKQGEAKKAKFCSQCGSPIAEGSKFCSNCGAKVE